MGNSPSRASSNQNLAGLLNADASNATQDGVLHNGHIHRKDHSDPWEPPASPSLQSNSAWSSAEIETKVGDVQLKEPDIPLNETNDAQRKLSLVDFENDEYGHLLGNITVENPTGGPVSSALNLSNTILGASALAMPHAAHGCGIPLYAVTLGIVCLMAEASVRMLVDCMKIAQRATYSGIGRKAHGKFGEKLTLAVVLLQQLGADIAFVKIIGTVLEPVVAKISGPMSNVDNWLMLLSAVVIFPLCMLPRIDFLKYSSIAAVLFVVAFMVMIAIDGTYKMSSGNIVWSDINWGPTSFNGVFLSVPLMSFAFVCHMNVFPVIAELKEPTRKRTNFVSGASMLTCLLVYVVGGVFGFLAFGSHVESDVIQSYEDLRAGKLGDSHHILVPVGISIALQAGIAVSLVFSFPIVAYELRNSAEELIFGSPEDRAAEHTELLKTENPEEEARRLSSSRKVNWKIHTSLNVLIVVVSTALAIEVKDVATVFDFVGATTSCFVVFILPAYFFICLSGQGKKWNHSWRMIFAYIQLVLGVILVPIGLSVQIMKTTGKG